MNDEYIYMIFLSGTRILNRSDCDDKCDALIKGIAMLESGDIETAINYLTTAFGSMEMARMWIRFSSINFENLSFEDYKTDELYVNLASSIIKMMNT